MALSARTAIAPRSAQAGPVLDQACCLSCSKCVVSEPDNECVKVGNHSVCERCRTQKQKCLPVSFPGLIGALLTT